MQDLANAIKKQVQTSYSMTYKNKDGTTTKVETTANVRVINNISEASESDHLFQVVNKGDFSFSGYGRAPLNGNQVYLNEQYVINMILGNDNNTIPHELGHTGGLKHSDRITHMEFSDVFDGQHFIPCTPCVEDNVNNAMYSGFNPVIGGTYLNDKTSTEINPAQIKVIQKNYEEDKLNKNTRGK
ncbi:hypothetical protein [Litoribacter populi]|uniref:hypothetical protein n=1 Tax=Litoribacter populi TaxID=2598460 RepID=UPI00117EA5B0|nr:hypothetical protein [Litoribacter populi]